MKSRLLLFAGSILILSTAGCGSDPFRVPWDGIPLESVIFSLDRDELNQPSGFSMAERRTVLVEAPAAEGRWDFALDRRDGGLVLLPPRSLGVDNRAGIFPVPGADWEDVREAPRDSLAFITEVPVPLEFGTIYVVRSHLQPDFFGQLCIFYGKLEAVELDVDRGAFRFLHDTNPECNNRRLVPPGN